jgi:hypothetical protein
MIQPPCGTGLSHFSRDTEAGYIDRSDPVDRRPSDLVLSRLLLLRGETTPPPSRWLRAHSELPLGGPDMDVRGVTSEPTTLRSLTKLGCFTCSTSIRLDGAEYNRPTAFTVQPLLADFDRSHYDRSRITCRVTKPVTLSSAHGHSVLAILILVHYSCRRVLACRPQGAEKPSLTSPTHPFCSLGLPRRSFLGRGWLLPPNRV